MQRQVTWQQGRRRRVGCRVMAIPPHLRHHLYGCRFSPALGACAATRCRPQNVRGHAAGLGSWFHESRQCNLASAPLPLASAPLETCSFGWPCTVTLQGCMPCICSDGAGLRQGHCEEAQHPQGTVPAGLQLPAGASGGGQAGAPCLLPVPAPCGTGIGTDAAAPAVCEEAATSFPPLPALTPSGPGSEASICVCA